MQPESIPFYVPWINKEDKKAVARSLESRWLTGGPTVAHFEKSFADYIGVRHAIAVNSCTAALHLALRVLGIGIGDEVIVPVFTFAATANAALFCGAKPVFADIDEDTFNLSPEAIMDKITPKTKAIIPVHYAGQPCDMKEILEIAEDHRLQVVEDCAHSLGAEYKTKKSGSLGIMGCFSFYPTKIITTLEGGMITTNDDGADRKLRLLREHGMSKTARDRESDATWSYDITDIGYNYRLTEPQAALGISQLKRVNIGIEKRSQAAHHYTKKLVLNGLVPPYESPDRSHIFHLYVVKIQKEKLGLSRDQLFEKLSRSGIGLGVHYIPLHLLSFYRKFVKRNTSFPVAERAYEQVLSLPLFPTLTRKNIDSVTQRIREIVQDKALSTSIPTPA